MEAEKQISVKFDNSLLDSLFFNYLSKEEYADIHTRLCENHSIICGFSVNDKPVFNVILDFEYSDNTLQVREFAGNFSGTEIDVNHGYKILNHFAEAFAKFLDFQFIRFHGERKFHKKMFASFGFNPLGNNDYVRNIH